MKLSHIDKSALIELAEHLVGLNMKDSSVAEYVISEIQRSIKSSGSDSFVSYLSQFGDTEEFSHGMEALLSNFTINHTLWFRESLQFKRLELELAKMTLPRHINIYCAACSTGQEAFSIGVILENFRSQNPGFEYNIQATDIDPSVIATAQRGVYPKKQWPAEIKADLRRFFLIGSGRTREYFTVSKEIRSRITFTTHDVRQPLAGEQQYDFIFCRNLFIYFSTETMERALKNFESRLHSKGVLFLSLNESFLPNDSQTSFIKGPCSSYQKAPSKFSSKSSVQRAKSIRKSIEQKAHPNSDGSTKEDLSSEPFKKEHKDAQKRKIFEVFTGKEDRSSRTKKRLLIIEDSKTIQHLLVKALSDNFDCVTVGTIEDAKKQILWSPDVVTLDLGLEGEDGREWLRWFREKDKETPVFILSGVSKSEGKKILGAIDDGAQGFFQKKDLGRSIDELKKCLIDLSHSRDCRAMSERECIGSKKHLKNNSIPFEKAIKRYEPIGATRERNQLNKTVTFEHAPFSFLDSPDLILVGSSTGGVQALRSFFIELGLMGCPIVVVQHIPQDFVNIFAGDLCRLTGLKQYQGAYPAPKLMPDTLYTCSYDMHLELKKMNGEWGLDCVPGPLDFGHRPSVNHLFLSAAQNHCKGVIALLMTGMGTDGAEGLLRVKEGGGVTLIQNQSSSVVYGMPKAAKELGAHHGEGSPAELARLIRPVGTFKENVSNE